MTAHLPVERPTTYRPSATPSRRLFLSYCRTDEPVAAAIARDLSDIGMDVWMDGRLSGGQAWWDTILEAIRSSDGVVFVLSGRSLDSLPCSRELGYAQALGKPVVPFTVDDTVPGLAPPSLASLEWVAYDPEDRASAIHLMRAIASMPPPPDLPDPLPQAPDVPLSYTTDLAALVHQADALPAHDQHSLLFQLREGLDDTAHRDECVQLMRQLRSRRELLASVERQIDEALRRLDPGGDSTGAGPRDAADTAVSIPPGGTSTPASPQVAGVAPGPRSRRVWVWVGLAAAVVAVLVGLFLVLRSGPSTPTPAPVETPAAPASYGDDALLDQLWDGCEAGDLTACDTLYLEADIGTSYETFGSTCGLTREPTYGECSTATEPDAESPSVYGDDATLDALWDACVAGDMAACDSLYYAAPVGTEYELKGSYCGGTSTEPMTGSCADR
ncbi:MAG: toll/interleukin-1 receptor domain-containing protein [Dermatophilaceae bacterium]